MEGYYIDDKGIKTIILSDTKMLNFSYMNLVELVCNSELETLWCFNNKLIQLKLNDKLVNLDCNNNPLTELKLNDNLKILRCSLSTKIENINNKTNIYIYG